MKRSEGRKKLTFGIREWLERELREQREDPDKRRSWLQRTVRYDPNMRFKNDPGLEWLWRELKITGRNIDQKLLNLDCLVANLTNQRTRPIQISRDRKKWIKQYHYATYQTNEIVDAMCELGYVDKATGYVDESGHRYQTRIWATEKLLDRFKEVRPGIEIKPKALVELKKNGKLVPYPENHQEADRVRKILAHANEVNSGYDIQCGGFSINPTLVAIYINDFSHYGRLHSRGYRHYQGIKKKKQKGTEKKIRPPFTIDGEPCVELDYRAIHPSLLYAAEGIQMEEDPYSKVNPDSRLRDLFKGSMLRMINADRADANQSIFEDLLSKKWRVYDSLGYGSPAIVIDAILEAHRPIEKYFLQGGDAGIRLMNKESRICLEVVRRFTRKGWPILPIHDSFITKAKHVDELERIMHESYQLCVPGYTIKTKVEWIGG